jgi:hypothetical protein
MPVCAVKRRAQVAADARQRHHLRLDRYAGRVGASNDLAHDIRLLRQAHLLVAEHRQVEAQGDGLVHPIQVRGFVEKETAGHG